MEKRDSKTADMCCGRSQVPLALWHVAGCRAVQQLPCLFASMLVGTMQCVQP